ncbi:MATE family efflux transporter [Anaerovibrio sp.]|uniref:MATE family efflux transporter n=1 Tax=Anaerovibrio sp. TaxID=1872532 RepID=UPI0025ED72DB|nr:MATE family efflux transporter [Anaerovibrio sp.]
MNMLEGSIWNKILKFAVPLAATSIMQQLFNAADVAVVGQFVGKEALAAVGANAIVINLMLNLFIGLSIGSNVVCAMMIGSKDYLRIKKTVHTSIVLSFVSGVFLAVLGVLFARDILYMVDTPAHIMDSAVLYLRILMGGVPLLLIYNFGSSLLRSKGDTKRPLYAMVISGTVNVLLNLFFVLELHMNVEGVAIATVLSSLVSAFLIIWWLHREKGPLQLRFDKLSMDKSILIHICRVGIPAGLQGMVFSFSNIIIQIALNNIGAEVVAATAIALNYEFAGFFILQAFAQAATTFVGQNYGAKNIERCYRVIRITMGMSVVITGIVSIAFSVFAYPLSAIFTTDPEVLQYSAVRIRYILTFEIINVVIETLSGAMRGVNYSMPPAIACMLGACVFRIIYVYTVFSMYPTFEVLMAVYPISWLVTVMVIIVLYRKVFKKVEKKLWKPKMA